MLAAWRIVINFEGRDSAGKRNAICRFVSYMNPRAMRLVALPNPTVLRLMSIAIRFHRHSDMDENESVQQNFLQRFISKIANEIHFRFNSIGWIF